MMVRPTPVVVLKKVLQPLGSWTRGKILELVGTAECLGYTEAVDLLERRPDIHRNSGLREDQAHVSCESYKLGEACIPSFTLIGSVPLICRVRILFFTG